MGPEENEGVQNNEVNVQKDNDAKKKLCQIVKTSFQTYMTW